MPNGAQRILSTVLLGLVYLALAVAAIRLTRFHGGVAFISVANAALLARLLTLRSERWMWPLLACAASGALATAWVGLGPAAAIPMVPMNVGEALIAAVILRRASASGFGSQAPLPWFLFAAGVAAPAASALGGALIATTFGADTYWHNWLNWYAGHALGALTFTPVAVYILRGDAKAWLGVARPAAALEALGLTLLVASTSVLVFAQDALPLLFLPLLPIILITFRLGRFAAAMSIVMLATIGGVFTISGHGPIGLLRGPLAMQVQFLQFYLACTVVTILPISAELARRASLYRRLHESEARYRLLTENSTDIVLNLDVDGRIRFASSSIREFGADAAELIGRPAHELVDLADVDAVFDALRKAVQDPVHTTIVEFRSRSRTAGPRWFEAHTRAALDDAGRIMGAVSAVREVGHRKAIEQRLSQAAMTDRLTGIANRAAFDTQLELAIQAARTAGPGCVAMFDLDHFKLVNDGFGHAAGDLVLRAFADLARARIRDVDFVARIGGEEFGIILPGASPEQASLICNRMRTAVAATPVARGGALVHITVSGGVAAYDGSRDAGEVLAAADKALYEAKRAGRDQMKLAA